MFNSALRAGGGGFKYENLSGTFLRKRCPTLQKHGFVSFSLLLYNCPFGRLYSVDIPSPSVTRITVLYTVQRKVMPLCTLFCIEYKLFLTRLKLPYGIFFNTFGMYRTYLTMVDFL